MNVLNCLQTAPTEKLQISSVCAEIPGTALLLELGSAPRDEYGDWVTTGVVAVIEALQSLQRMTEREHEDVNPVTVVCAGIPDDLTCAIAADALFEAVRGIVQSVTLESAAQSLQCNVLRVARISDGSLAAVLRYLASSAGGFALGTTLNLAGSR